MPFSPAELDVLLYISGPVLVLVGLVCLACREWASVHDEHLNPDEPHGFR